MVLVYVPSTIIINRSIYLGRKSKAELLLERTARYDEQEGAGGEEEEEDEEASAVAYDGSMVEKKKRGRPSIASARKPDGFLSITKCVKLFFFCCYKFSLFTLLVLNNLQNVAHCT